MASFKKHGGTASSVLHSWGRGWVGLGPHTPVSGSVNVRIEFTHCQETNEDIGGPEDQARSSKKQPLIGNCHVPNDRRLVCHRRMISDAEKETYDRINISSSLYINQIHQCRQLISAEQVIALSSLPEPVAAKYYNVRRHSVSKVC